MRHQRNRSLLKIGILGTVILLRLVHANAQDVTAPALKAAYIYNIAKFTSWPELGQEVKSFGICVVGDPSIADALQRAVQKRMLAGAPISVFRLTAAIKPKGCHVLYISGVSGPEASQWLNEFRGAPVLTISDFEGFTNIGGMVQFFFQHGQLRFKLALEPARAANLQISAKLLPLAKSK